jgi:hypothetical protein
MEPRVEQFPPLEHHNQDSATDTAFIHVTFWACEVCKQGLLSSRQKHIQVYDLQQRSVVVQQHWLRWPARLGSEQLSALMTGPGQLNPDD